MALSLMWGTCFGLVATGSTTETSMPAVAMDARSPFTVPSVKGFVWDAACNLLTAAGAIASGKVWV